MAKKSQYILNCLPSPKPEKNWTIETAVAAGLPSAKALSAKSGVEVVRCGSHRVDLVNLMELLEARGVRSVVAEGVSQLLRSLFTAGIVSRIIVKHIPVVTGAVGAASYLGEGAPSFPLSRWRVEDVFLLSGVPVTIYAPFEKRS